jgi:hypothetical protein
MDITIGKWAAGIRQTILRTKQVHGVSPRLLGPPIVLYVPAYAENIFYYRHPTTSTTIVADDGGVFTFGSADYSVIIPEIHIAFGAPSTVNIDITDSDGSYARHLYVGAPAVDARFTPTDAFILPGQKLVITETASGVPAVGVNKVVTVYAIQEGRV